MNIQIFGKSKCFDTKKAQRWFSERGIRVQNIDMNAKETAMSRGEFLAVMRAVGGLDQLIDGDCRDKELLTLLKYMTDDARVEKVFENQVLIRTPIVRNGKQATVGYVPDIWKSWT